MTQLDAAAEAAYTRPDGTRPFATVGPRKRSYWRAVARRAVLAVLSREAVAAAVEPLVLEAMASGVVCFADKAAAGEVDPSGSIKATIGDYAGTFLRLRPSLVDDVVAHLTGEEARR